LPHIGLSLQIDFEVGKMGFYLTSFPEIKTSPSGNPHPTLSRDGFDCLFNDVASYEE